MGLSRVVKRAWCVVGLLCVSSVAHAGTVTLSNGLPNLDVGHLDITMDDFGSFGRWVGPNDCDNYTPPVYGHRDPMTNVTTSLLFIYAGANKGGVELTGYSILYKLLEGAQGDGIEGTFTNLTRTVTQPITGSGAMASSAFQVADTTSGVKLDIGLVTQIVSETNPVVRLDQEYTVTNSGTAQVTLVWHALWDMNILYGGSGTSADDDVVGVGQGLCYTYMHDPGSSIYGGAFIDGGSQIGVPGAMTKLDRSAYFGAKEDVMPEGTLTPAFSVPTSTLAKQFVWASYKMPASWVDELADVGKDKAGESTSIAPAAVGHEYQFALAPGQVAVIRLKRYWGTISLPCVSVGVNCGNGVVDTGEMCDSGGVDMPECNGATCTPPACGDGITNAAAGEQCESNMLDTADCNGTLCTTPACGDGYLNVAAGEACDEGRDSATCNLANCQAPACGDGIVNAAAGEQCETGALCDVATCTYQFSLGGGCAGCGVDGDAGSLALAGFVGMLITRRRRARRA